MHDKAIDLSTQGMQNFLRDAREQAGITDTDEEDSEKEAWDAAIEQRKRWADITTAANPPAFENAIARVARSLEDHTTTLERNERTQPLQSDGNQCEKRRLTRAKRLSPPDSKFQQLAPDQPLYELQPGTANAQVNSRSSSRARSNKVFSTVPRAKKAQYDSNRA